MADDSTHHVDAVVTTDVTPAAERSIQRQRTAAAIFAGAAVAVLVSTALNLVILQPRLERASDGAELLRCTLEVIMRSDLEQEARARLFAARCGVDPAP